MAKLDNKIVSLLKKADAPMTLKEIAAEVGKPEKAVFRALRRLFKKEKINCVNRRYKLVEN
ncbi:MAG: AsnC family protein [Thermoproteota archaeon]|nr:AsnC family protein [Thermoproteota archaeon]